MEWITTIWPELVPWLSYLAGAVGAGALAQWIIGRLAAGEPDGSLWNAPLTLPVLALALGALPAFALGLLTNQPYSAIQGSVAALAAALMPQIIAGIRALFPAVPNVP